MTTKQRRLRSVAWGLMVSTIIFWLWFGVGSAWVEGAGLLGWVMHVLVPAGIFLLTTVAARYREGPGGALLVLEGLAGAAFVARAYMGGHLPISTLTLMLLTLVLPPLAAGVLLLLHSRAHSRQAEGCDGQETDRDLA